MSLELITGEVSNLSLDVEKDFLFVTNTDTELTRTLLREIDNCEYVNANFVKDRFGVELPINYVSTGCKIALCLANGSFKNKVINGVEAGHNAITEIVKYIKNGKLYIRDTAYCISSLEDADIDIVYKGYNFTRLYDFADYMQNSWPLTPEEALEEGSL